MKTNHLTIGIYGIQDITNSGVPTVAHDHAVAVMQQGKLIYYVHLERIDRLKHSNALPHRIYGLLKEKKLLNADSEIVFTDNMTGRAFINIEGNIRMESSWPEVLGTGTESACGWWLEGFREVRILNHELAHIGSCLPFFGDFKPNSLLIHFDGGASRSNFSAWYFDGKQISLLAQHWEFKWLSGMFNANALMFGILGAKSSEMNSVPGKMMGFSSYGKYRPELEEWLTRNQFFADCWKNKQDFIAKAQDQFGIKLAQLSTRNGYLQDIAATMQFIFTRETLKAMQQLQQQTGARHLYYSGGSALNILTNTQIIKHGGFESVFIPPCCNDSGLALGAAAFREWETGNEIYIHKPFLNNWNIEKYQVVYQPETIAMVARLLLQRKVIGVCNGYGEAGPRALGNRSIIGLADDCQLAAKISMQHKGREWYRPVAPIMLERNVQYFTGEEKIHELSRFMLIDFLIRPEKRKEIEGVVHVDGTSRIQTLLRRDDNEFMYDLLDYMDGTYKIKALINTSFNRKGEPIVHTVNDALESARAMRLDAVILNGELVIL